MGMEGPLKKEDDPKRAEVMARASDWAHEIHEARKKEKDSEHKEARVGFMSNHANIAEEVAGIVYDLQSRHIEDNLSDEDIQAIKAILEKAKSARW